MFQEKGFHMYLNVLENGNLNDRTNETGRQGNGLHIAIAGMVC